MRVSWCQYGFKVSENWFEDEPVNHGAGVEVHKAVERKVSYGDEYKPQHTLCIDLTKPLNEIKGGMKKSSCRHSIRYAEENPETQVIRNGDYSKYVELEEGFRRKKGLNLRHKRKYLAYRDSKVYLGKLSGEVVSGQIYITDSDAGKCRWLWGASKRLSKPSKSTEIGKLNRLLVWTAIQDAKEEGFRELDLGGYYFGEPNEAKDNINFFKKSFGGEVKKKHYYKKFNKRIPKYLYRLKEVFN